MSKFADRFKKRNSKNETDLDATRAIRYDGRYEDRYIENDEPNTKGSYTPENQGISFKTITLDEESVRGGQSAAPAEPVKPAKTEPAQPQNTTPSASKASAYPEQGFFGKGRPDEIYGDPEFLDQGVSTPETATKEKAATAAKAESPVTKAAPSAAAAAFSAKDTAPVDEVPVEDVSPDEQWQYQYKGGKENDRHMDITEPKKPLTYAEKYQKGFGTAAGAAGAAGAAKAKEQKAAKTRKTKPEKPVKDSSKKSSNGKGSKGMSKKTLWTIILVAVTILVVVLVVVAVHSHNGSGNVVNGTTSSQDELTLSDNMNTTVTNAAPTAAASTTETPASASTTAASTTGERTTTEEESTTKAKATKTKTEEPSEDPSEEEIISASPNENG